MNSREKARPRGGRHFEMLRPLQLDFSVGVTHPRTASMELSKYATLFSGLTGRDPRRPAMFFFAARAHAAAAQPAQPPRTAPRADWIGHSLA